MTTNPKPAIDPAIRDVLLWGFRALPQPVDSLEPAIRSQFLWLYRAGPSALAALWWEHGPELLQYAKAQNLRPINDSMFFAQRVAHRAAQRPIVTETREPRLKEQLAVLWHEAAHSVAAVLYDVPVARVTARLASDGSLPRGYIIPRTEAISLDVADGLYEPRPELYGLDAVEGDLESYLRVLVAGGLAYARFVGHRDGDGDWQDRLQAEHLLALSLDAPAHGQAVAAEMSRLDTLVAADIKTHWAWIGRVARELMRRTTIAGHDVQRLRDAPDEETSRQSDDEPSAAARDNAHAFARAFIDASSPGGSAELADVLAETARRFIARKIETQAGLRDDRRGI